jgi:hypothetical protein
MSFDETLFPITELPGIELDQAYIHGQTLVNGTEPGPSFQL